VLSAITAMQPPRSYPDREALQETRGARSSRRRTRTVNRMKVAIRFTMYGLDVAVQVGMRRNCPNWAGCWERSRHRGSVHETSTAAELLRHKILPTQITRQ
jgi:hypothetical protein